MVNIPKVIANIIHLVAIIIGLILFAVTIFIMANPSTVMTVLETETVTAICAFVCALSVLIIVVATIGFLGTQTESAPILKIFVALVIVCLFIEISAMVTPFGMRRRWEDKFNDQIFSLMDKYGQDAYPYLTEMWDDFQTNWRCCGSYKAEDWSFSAYVQQEFYPVLVPPSCCISFMSSGGVKPKCVQRNDTSLYYTKGCLKVTKEYIWSYMGVVGGLSIGVFVCQILVILLSVLLIKEFDYREGENAGEFEPAPPRSAITKFRPIPRPYKKPDENFDNGNNGEAEEIDL